MQKDDFIEKKYKKKIYMGKTHEKRIFLKKKKDKMKKYI